MASSRRPDDALVTGIATRFRELIKPETGESTSKMIMDLNAMRSTAGILLRQVQTKRLCAADDLRRYHHSRGSLRSEGPQCCCHRDLSVLHFEPLQAATCSTK